jgi:protocatechuate 3,4-dioxygenase beta subunit
MRNWQPILLGAVLTACDSPIHAAGVVRDGRGVGVPGATVSVWRVEQSGAARGQTDSTGHFAVVHTGSPRGRVTVQACHSGYAIVQQAWADERGIPDTIVLVLRQPAVADAADGC